MINFNTNSFNALANLKVRVKGVDEAKTSTANSSQSVSLSINSSVNSQNSISSQISNNSLKNSSLVTDKSKAVSEILSYGVDSEGYFTSEFNEAAGIPEDYKIHSSTMQSLVKSQTTAHNLFYPANFQSIDIAKTIGNAYKIVSQLLENSPELANKDSFSQDDLATYFPRNYITNDAGEVVRTYTTNQAQEVVDLGGFTLGADEKLNLSFTTLRYTNGVVSDYDAFSFDGDILHSTMFGGKEGVYSFNTTSDKYTNADGSITKGGLLIGFLSHNTFSHNAPSPLIAGEVSIQGKINGMDKNTSQAEINSLLSFMQSNLLVLDSENYGEFNDLMNLNLSIDKFKQAYLKLKQDTENRRKNEQNSIEATNPKTQAMKILLEELQKMNERLSKGDLGSVKAQNFDEILADLNLNFKEFEKLDLKA